MKQLLFILLVFISFQGFSQESVKLKQLGLEVMTKDIGQMNWGDAKEICKGFGDGWRLPTFDELKKIHKYKDFIGGFANDFYWSSTEDDEDDAAAKALEFPEGDKWYFSYYKIKLCYVRAVRTLK